ncbi:MAG: EFR1 family ferrodoxin [Oscillospiraceae bacterium]|nr:EFR1 family ferrodoxin [Oscillospiraceae bacterium]
MIFYYTGTGNSLFAARKLLYRGEQLVNMAEACQNHEFVYQIPTHERVGFVYPELCGAVPETVCEFVKQAILNNVRYVFAVVTCAGERAMSAQILEDLLAERFLPLQYANFVTMPNNALIYADVQTDEKAAAILKTAEQRLGTIREELRKHPIHPADRRFLPKITRRIYPVATATKKFFADENCIGCGICAKICPSKAIEMQNGMPVWVKSHCDLCVGCINRCPKQAIQYGKSTKNRTRYVNPVLKQAAAPTDTSEEA